jgi:predicted DNA-binding protein (UPF0251 family)
MVRPYINRKIRGEPAITYFKPQGIPLRVLEELNLTLDGLEALKLADVEGLYHDAAAAKMGVSRPTFGRILAQARKVVSTAIAEGKALRIEGGVVKQIPQTTQRCWGRGRNRFRRNWGRR